jgi:hypothetical protein
MLPQTKSDLFPPREKEETGILKIVLTTLFLLFKKNAFKKRSTQVIISCFTKASSSILIATTSN